MTHRFTLGLGALILAASLAGPLPCRAQSPDPLARLTDPLARPIAAPPVETDVSAAPDLAAWADRAKRLVHDWFPLITPLLATDGYRRPARVRLVFKPDISAPAYTANAQITINATWVRAHPDDFGMVIHELTHVIQEYHHRGNPGWLVEGIADYIRWWRYEPDVARTPVNPEKATYHDSYRTTAAFLAYVTGKYNRGLVRGLDRAMRAGAYSDDLFRDLTGKTVAELWSEFVATIGTPRGLVPAHR